MYVKIGRNSRDYGRILQRRWPGKNNTKTALKEHCPVKQGVEGLVALHIVVE